ncbi:hypothetical protein D9757_011156 [Collybiopsis confluens]|uniref:Uncharacterized protein n=1 Tax=Collybiopsis confluens TaxID=2823264 RepID=A0A8H5H868_9AGAR|nr:hypothetical protein D9757_011156 [Collybiopsis confluens]
MTERHPILAFIEGIDTQIRTLSSAEVDELTRATSPSLGDWFTQWLTRTPVNQRLLTFRTFLNMFTPSRYQIFGVSDGVTLVYDSNNPSNPLNSVDRHMRYICVVLPDAEPGSGINIQDAIINRTLFLVGGSFPDGDGNLNTGSGGFLQCASWDPHAYGRNRGITRFYQRNREGWIYFGDSFNAFKVASADRGPFDGHVGGAIIMKELTAPWTHWFDSGNVGQFERSLGSARNQPSLADPHNVLHDPLFTPPGGRAYALLSRAESLERVVENSINSWYRTRFHTDFINPGTGQPHPVISTAIQHWVGHILLNRAMNIATSATASENVIHSAANIEGIPGTLFYNGNALEIILRDAGPERPFGITNDLYRQSVASLELSLYYRDRATGELRVAVPGSEGPFAFPIIEPGAEDYIGIQTLTVQARVAQLLPQKAIAAMLMVDFPNPLYSSRRESLMKYLPETATFNSQTSSYNVIDQFISKVRASAQASNPSSAEYEILNLLNTPDGTYIGIFTKRINDYLGKVHARLQPGAGGGVQSALEDYMILAESRRKIYRGREDAKPGGSGLNEFVMTLPRAGKEVPYTRMKEDGHIEVMPAGDVERFLRKKPSAGTCPVYVSRDNDGVASVGL